MASSRSAQALVAQLRALAPSHRRRSGQPADAAGLLAQTLGTSRDVQIVEQAAGVAFRFALDGGERLTCLLHRPSAPLTAVEAAVAALACDGFTSSRIAQLRGVSTNTVKSQLRQVFRKLGVASRLELVKRLGL